MRVTDEAGVCSSPVTIPGGRGTVRTVAWVYPLHARCGISFYSRKYVAALRVHTNVVEIDSGDIVKNPARMSRLWDAYDLVHIQYEVSLFGAGTAHNFDRAFSRTPCPLIVSLHEVYEEFPDVFPRSRLRGNFLTKAVRRCLYDMRHPFVTAFARHVRSNFFARTVLVHSHWQRDVLAAKGPDPAMIRVIAYPVARSPRYRRRGTPHEPAFLAATGFINPSFDYSLLVAGLARLEKPWRFVWIGGPRKVDGHPLLSHLREEIRQRGWESRFEITGWVDDEERDRLLSQVDVFCALFRSRSSSESLATALGAGCPVVATPLPFIKELVRHAPVVHVVEPDPAAVANGITGLLEDASMRDRLQDATGHYLDEAGFDRAASRVAAVYREVAGT